MNEQVEQDFFIVIYWWKQVVVKYSGCARLHVLNYTFFGKSIFKIYNRVRYISHIKFYSVYCHFVYETYFNQDLSVYDNYELLKFHTGRVTNRETNFYKQSG